MQAARATGADVPVCLDPRPRLMRGIGDVLSAPLDLPRLFAVLVNPGVAVSTRDVFAALNLASGPASGGASCSRPACIEGWGAEPTAFVAALAKERNDLEAPAIELEPVIAERSRRAARAAGLPARAHVGIGRDLLRPVRRAMPQPPPRRERCGSAIRNGGCGRRCWESWAVVGRPGARAHPTAPVCPTGPR